MTHINAVCSEKFRFAIEKDAAPKGRLCHSKSEGVETLVLRWVAAAYAILRSEVCGPRPLFYVVARCAH
jgi:hypothetical protein